MTTNVYSPLFHRQTGYSRPKPYLYLLCLLPYCDLCLAIPPEHIQLNRSNTAPIGLSQLTTNTRVSNPSSDGTSTLSISSTLPQATLEPIVITAQPTVKLDDPSTIALTNSTTDDDIDNILINDTTLSVQPYTKDGGSSFGINIRGLNVGHAYLNDLPDIGRLYQRDPATLESIHVVSGASGLTHSSESLGGYINQQLKSPSIDQSVFQVSQTAVIQPLHAVNSTRNNNKLSSSYHIYDIGQPYQVSSDTHIAYRLSGSEQFGKDEWRLSKRKSSQLLGLQLVHFTPIAEHQATLWWDRQRSEQPFNFGSIISEDQPLYKTNFTDNRAPTLRKFNRLQAEYHRKDDNNTLILQYAHSQVDRDEVLKGFWYKTSETSLAGYESKFIDDYKQQDWRLNWQNSTDINIGNQRLKLRHHTVLQDHRHHYDFIGSQSIGGFNIDVNNDNWTSAHSEPNSFYPRYKKLDYKNQSIGYSMTADIPAIETSVKAGLRWTKFDVWQQPRLDIPFTQVAYGKHLNHQLAIGHQLSDKWQVKLSHTQSSKPNLAMSKKGDFLKSKRAVQHEVAATYTGEQNTAKVSLYQQKLDNLIKRDPDDRNFFILNGEANVRGISISTESQINDDWRVKLGYHLIDTKDRNGEPFTGLAKQRAHLNIAHDFIMVNKQASVSLNNSFFTKRCLPRPSICVPPYVHSNLYADIKINPKVKLFAGIKNMWNKKQVLDMDSENTVYIAEPRKILIGWQYQH